MTVLWSLIMIIIKLLFQSIFLLLWFPGQASLRSSTPWQTQGVECATVSNCVSNHTTGNRSARWLALWRNRRRWWARWRISGVIIGREKTEGNIHAMLTGFVIHLQQLQQGLPPQDCGLQSQQALQIHNRLIKVQLAIVFQDSLSHFATLHDFKLKDQTQKLK